MTSQNMRKGPKIMFITFSRRNMVYFLFFGKSFFLFFVTFWEKIDKILKLDQDVDWIMEITKIWSDRNFCHMGTSYPSFFVKFPKTWKFSWACSFSAYLGPPPDGRNFLQINDFRSRWLNSCLCQIIRLYAF